MWNSGALSGSDCLADIYIPSGASLPGALAPSRCSEIFIGIHSAREAVRAGGHGRCCVRLPGALRRNQDGMLLAHIRLQEESVPVQRMGGFVIFLFEEES